MNALVVGHAEPAAALTSALSEQGHRGGAPRRPAPAPTPAVASLADSLVELERRLTERAPGPGDRRRHRRRVARARDHRGEARRAARRLGRRRAAGHRGTRACRAPDPEHPRGLRGRPGRRRRRRVRGAERIASWANLELGHMKVGIIGLGLRRPAARGRVRRGGLRRRRARRRPPRGRGHRARREHGRGRALRAPRAAGRRADRGDHRPRAARRLRRGHDLRADAARPSARARPRLRRLRGPLAGGGPARGPARRARVDHLPGHHPRPPDAALLEESGLRAGTDFHLAFSPERIDPGRTDHTIRTTPKLVGGLTPDLPRPRGRALLPDLRRGRAAVLARGGRAGEAPREHLPLGQHRPGQRAGDARRPDGHRHLGGGRRGRHQAVRVHALRAGARDGRPLPADRPVLPRVQGPRVRLPDRVHRAGRKDQPAAAALLRRQDRARAERRRPPRPRLARPDARRLLQGRGRRPARVARAADRPPPARARSRGLLPRPARPESVPDLGPALGRRSRGALRAATSPASSPPTPRSTTSAVVAEAPLVVDFRGVTRGIEAANLVRL